MKIRLYLIISSSFITIILAGLLFSSVWSVMMVSDSYSSDQFLQEMSRLAFNESEYRARLIFDFVDHLSGYGDSGGSGTILNHTNRDDEVSEFIGTIRKSENVVTYNFNGSPLISSAADGNPSDDSSANGVSPDVSPLDLFPEQSEQIRGLDEKSLQTAVNQALGDKRLSFTYPPNLPESRSGDPESEIQLVHFRIFPELNLVLGVSTEIRRNSDKVRLFQDDLRQHRNRVLFIYCSAIVFISFFFMLLIQRFFSRRFIAPLYQIESGLCSLRKQNFTHRLKIRSSTELKSISESFNDTASVLEALYGEAARREKQYRTLIENIPQKVFLKDLEGRYISCNDTYAADLGIDSEQIEGYTDFDFFPEYLAQKYRRDDKRIIATGLTEIIEEQYISGENIGWIQITKTPVFDQANVIIGVLGIFFDITEIKEKEKTIRELNENLESEVRKRTRELQQAYKKMEELSITDALTGLNNKRYFEQSADLLWRKCRRNGTSIGMLMIDIDSFKTYNDNYGHVQGDEALKVVAECIHLSVNRPEDLAARFGGEEFVILLADVDVEGLSHVAENLRRMLESRQIPHEYSEARSKFLTLSIGACLGRVSDDDPGGIINLDVLLKKADDAMYSAKRAGRNRFEIAV